MILYQKDKTLKVLQGPSLHFALLNLYFLTSNLLLQISVLDFLKPGEDSYS